MAREAACKNVQSPHRPGTAGERQEITVIERRGSQERQSLNKIRTRHNKRERRHAVLDVGRRHRTAVAVPDAWNARRQPGRQPHKKIARVPYLVRQGLFRLIHIKILSGACATAWPRCGLAPRSSPPVPKSRVAVLQQGAYDRSMRRALLQPVTERDTNDRPLQKARRPATVARGTTQRFDYGQPNSMNSTRASARSRSKSSRYRCSSRDDDSSSNGANPENSLDLGNC